MGFPLIFGSMSHFTHHYEENYLKTLFKLGSTGAKKVNNIALAKAMGLNPATVLEMVRKLGEKKLIRLLSDKSIQLTEKGRKKALLIIRKHRLWEVFLVNKLNYTWSEVHELAEQLEHIGSEDMINRLEVFLGHPSVDPHGDPIPDKNGQLKVNHAFPLSTCTEGRQYIVQHFAETADEFLAYLSQLQISPGEKLKVLSFNEYDQSCMVIIRKNTVQLSEKVAKNILVQNI